MSAAAALLPFVERRGGATVIGAILVIGGIAELIAGMQRRQARTLAMLAGALTVLAGALFATGPATEFFLPSIVIVMGWLLVRSIVLFVTTRNVTGGVRKWTLLSSATDLLLALLLLVGFQIAAIVLAIVGATADLAASFAWIIGISFVTNGLMLLEVAACMRRNGTG